MAKEEQAFVIACGELARLLGVSLASARRRVDQAAAAAGQRDRPARLAMALEMLEVERGAAPRAPLLDALLNTDEDGGGFIVEDD
ncbi:hypothetical protein EVJ50_07825 [Synechococcus sp. RSCCF101]|uniref:hypothetical protein n=1 Tax=Synechococcus sp. RSCCF101 TaxID=2511069 RepID=UPI001248640B|nr:hypothetical protein [Synechococcus sp. RSCCF101]QEY32145.1 hypothetical protein EVJ50_07825 [Synechococcus sp. RSCCF101]